MRDTKYALSVSMEDMLKKQISLMDQFREVMDITSKRIIQSESVIAIDGAVMME
jgi:hypothetical protein